MNCEKRLMIYVKNMIFNGIEGKPKMCETCYYFRGHCIWGQAWPLCRYWPRTTSSTLIEADNERRVADMMRAVAAERIDSILDSEKANGRERKSP